MAPLQNSNPAPAQLKRPSERAIAFATSVVRSKPDGLSVKGDYLISLFIDYIAWHL